MSHFETLSTRKMIRMAFGIDIEEELRWQKRERPLGFPVSEIKGGTPDSPSGALAVTQPQLVYEGRRLFVIPSAPYTCIVQDLKVGKDSQLATTEPIPAEMFAPSTFGSDMNMDTAAVSMIVSLFLGNTGKTPISATAGIMGTSYDPVPNIKKKSRGKKK